MQAIATALAAERWPARIATVISHRPHAGGLDWAREQGLNTVVIDHTGFASREAFDAALAAEIDRYAPDLVVLAGFMRILTEGFVQHFAGRLMNIHPSLLPAFAGLHTHQRALDAGCKVAGATVHFVTPTLDHGPVVIQAAVPVLPGDDEARLAARVLACEHVIYPRAVRWFLADELHLGPEGRVLHRHGEPQWLWAEP